MSVDLAAIKQDIADLVTAATAGSDYAISAYVFWPDNPMTPVFAPGETEADYVADTGGAVDLTMTWRLAVGHGETEAAQALLDTYLSTGAANSIIDAINADSRCTAESGDGYRVFEWAGKALYGAEITVTVLT